MVSVRNDIPLNEIQGLSNGGIQIYSRNLLAEQAVGEIIIGTQLGVQANLDQTDPDFPIVRAFDGFGNIGARALTGLNAASWYLGGRIVEQVDPIEIDSAILRLSTNANSIASVELLLSDDPGIQTGAGAIGPNWATWSTGLTHNTFNPGHGRFYARYIGNGANTQQVLTLNAGPGDNLWFTFRINLVGSGPCPFIHEAFLGRRRVLSRPPNYPWDDEPRGVDKTSFQAKGRAEQEYVRATSFSDHEMSFTPTGVDQFNLDDLATLQRIWDDSLGAQNSVWFVNGRDFDRTYLMRIDQEEFRENLVGFVERRGAVRLKEQPVFANAQGEQHILANTPDQTVIPL